ncbi:hypothetical protein KAFR_0K01570 [Kazachstania africana CBS 2517]|uniref:Uncharacterized protein n=1 Tax=Kazachstania africana (strain ATCC 22294 / BCRC 22015 / CBS 2517 / CECT 1963 / NBRC 1671 / NRRL Y-8276) TaxID=1071382 RepID=H2B1L1_KAZAF|nr:hypothetical protein KAFR_0K01570 [Kazachstania africana CBS 2517]CCF60511.1 hypothetical protein KAFR_0K01570 [Kazachstania africana CBS 2517]
MQVQTGYLNKVDGSSHYENKSVKVICSVTGPIEPKARQELPTQLALEVTVRPAIGVPTTREITLQDKIRGVISPIICRYKYPRQLCQITLQILESGEEETLFNVKELIGCINSTVFALIDAAIAINSIAVGVSMAVMGDGTFIVDPSNEQLKKSVSTHALVFQLVDGSKVVENVLLLDSFGNFDESTLFEVLEYGEKHALSLAKDFRKTIETKIKKDLFM